MKERVPPPQMGIIVMSKGPYFEPISISYYIPDTSHQRRRRPKRADWGETFEDGTRATSRHVS